MPKWCWWSNPSTKHWNGKELQQRMGPQNKEVDGPQTLAALLVSLYQLVDNWDLENCGMASTDLRNFHLMLLGALPVWRQAHRTPMQLGPVVVAHRPLLWACVFHGVNWNVSWHLSKELLLQNRCAPQMKRIHLSCKVECYWQELMEDHITNDACMFGMCKLDDLLHWRHFCWKSVVVEAKPIIVFTYLTTNITEMCVAIPVLGFVLKLGKL